MPRTILIGDVHGCLDEFRELLLKVSYAQGQDRLIQVGDLMDRGPDPAGCVRFAREAGAVVLKGNHEDKHIRWRGHEEKRKATGKKNPVRLHPDAQAQNLSLTDEEIEWMANLPLSHEIAPNFFAVHAGCEPRFTFEDQSETGLTKVRFVDKTGKMAGYKPKEKGGDIDYSVPPENSEFWSTRWAGPQSVVYGHAVLSLSAPRVDFFPGGACFGIDTGCVFGGRLTAMVITDRAVEFAQVPAREVYFDHFYPTDLS